jgi:Siphovirus ReqiPepy6 Gp37-like protein
VNDAIAVYADGVDSSVKDSARRVLLVKADDLDLAVGAPLTAAMQQRGLEELAKHRSLYAFDGEIPQHQPYVYGVDYNLGDLVEERSPDGFISQLIVTEQIFVSDSSGELSYPTLTLKELLLPGTWVARPIAEHWADVPDDQVWANQP